MSTSVYCLVILSKHRNLASFKPITFNIVSLPKASLRPLRWLTLIQYLIFFLKNRIRCLEQWPYSCCLAYQTRLLKQLAVVELIDVSRMSPPTPPDCIFRLPLLVDSSVPSVRCRPCRRLSHPIMAWWQLSRWGLTSVGPCLVCCSIAGNARRQARRTRRKLAAAAGRLK